MSPPWQRAVDGRTFLDALIARLRNWQRAACQLLDAPLQVRFLAGGGQHRPEHQTHGQRATHDTPPEGMPDLATARKEALDDRPTPTRGDGLADQFALLFERVREELLRLG
jgi:hypothetical protein